MLEKWDLAIILDACRYDRFEIRNEFPGNLKKMISPGLYTPEWIEATFEDWYFGDTVYVTANPFISQRAKEQFLEVIPLWKNDWSDELSVVSPEVVSLKTLRVIKKHPLKVIAHYMQPHEPFIGSPGFLGNVPPRKLVIEGYITDVFFKLAYDANLLRALRAIEPLFMKLPDDHKVIITSDHGTFLGEDDCYIHPFNKEHPARRHVPWLEVDIKEFKEIKGDVSLHPMNILDDSGGILIKGKPDFDALGITGVVRER